jgi:uncharacterized membrane protein (UPF0127 family)
MNISHTIRTTLAALCVLALFAPSFAQDTPQLAYQGKPQTGLPKMALTANGHAIKADIANTEATRQTGLMFRASMGKNEGMLFVFPQLGYHAMWMRNTLIPLSVAYMDDHGKILSIHEMEALNETSHMAAGPARYALEMNAKWFAGNKVQVGDVIKGLEKAPKPQ